MSDVEGQTLYNPIINRELIGMLRTRKAFILQVVLVVIFALLVVLRWPTSTQVDLSGSQSKQVFRLFGYGLLTSIILLVPVFPATSVVREKIKGSLALLLISPMSSLAIYVGKLMGVMGFVMLLLVLSLPSIAACYSMGGVSLFQEIIPLYTILLLTALEYAALGLLISSYVNSTDAAIRTTYGVILLLAVVAMGPYLFFQGQEGILPTISIWLRSISPIPASMEVLGHSGVGSQGFIAPPSLIKFSVLTPIISLSMMAWATSRMNLRMLDRTRDQGQITDELSSSQQWLRRFLFLVDPQRRKAGTPAYVNPVMVKEFRCRRFGRLTWILRIVSVCALVSLLLTYAAASGSESWGPETIGGIMVLLQVALIVLLTPGLASGLIAAERESGGWQLLQMTPLSWYDILLGKLLSVIFPLLIILSATLPGYVVLMRIQPDMWPQIMDALVCLLLTAAFALALSSFISSCFQRTAVATAVSFSTLVVICAGTMLVWLLRDAPFGHDTVEAVLKINPLAAALNVIDMPGFEKYEIFAANSYFMGISTVVLMIALAFRTWRLTRPL